jgi:hypothetical protein
MSRYILDLVVEEAQLYQCCSSIQSPFFIAIRADGLQQEFVTPHVPASPQPAWRCPVRLILNLPHLNNYHLRASLRTTLYHGQVAAVASAQVRLASLPTGQPIRISFPLQLAHDHTVQAATLTVTASLSPLPQAQTRPGTWGPQQGTQQPAGPQRALPNSTPRRF